MLARVQRTLELAFILVVAAALLTAGDPVNSEAVDRARAFTRPLEFDYVSWSAAAAWTKMQSSALGLPEYLSRETRVQVVMESLYLTDRLNQAEAGLALLYADPAVADKEAASAHLRMELETLRRRHAHLAPIAEAVLQDQVAAALAELELTAAGQPVPPVLYRSSAVPMGLIISPRERIEQIANISIEPGMSVDQQAVLEARVDQGLDVSSLVVPIGGVGVYPTMIMRTSDLPWLLDTIAHEWAHNYLTLRPLGVLYDATPELRTMNETTASIVGGEVGRLVLESYYPNLIAGSPHGRETTSIRIEAGGQQEEAPPFDFRAEMHETRVTTDRLLSQGMVEEAETYLETRRQLFWQNGYPLRKLNQAYFAFYGAYADVPGGAAGEDPVGPAVRALRAQSPSLAAFIRRISWMTSFEQLQAAVAGTSPGD